MNERPKASCDASTTRRTPKRWLSHPASGPATSSAMVVTDRPAMISLIDHPSSFAALPTSLLRARVAA